MSMLILHCSGNRVVGSAVPVLLIEMADLIEMVKPKVELMPHMLSHTFGTCWLPLWSSCLFCTSGIFCTMVHIYAQMLLGLSDDYSLNPSPEKWVSPPQGRRADTPWTASSQSGVKYFLVILSNLFHGFHYTVDLIYLFVLFIVYLLYNGNEEYYSFGLLWKHF